MNKKILIAGLLVSIMLIVPINSAYSNIDIPIDNKPIIKTNPVNPSNGTVMKTFGGTKDDYGTYVQQTTDGGYIITGVKDKDGYVGGDVWLIKTDSNGDKTWDRTFGGQNIDWSNCVQQTTDGGYIITGEKGSYFTEHYDIWLIKTDKDGRPRDKSISSSLLLRFLERYPLLNLLFQKLLL